MKVQDVLTLIERMPRSYRERAEVFVELDGVAHAVSDLKIGELSNVRLIAGKSRDAPAEAECAPYAGYPIEHAIVRKLLRTARANGFELDDITIGDDETFASSEEAAMSGIFQADESTVSFKIRDKEGIRGAGRVVLTCGKREDIIGDWWNSEGDPDEFDAMMRRLVNEIRQEFG